MLKKLLNEKYELLKYMYDHCVWVDDEFVIKETIEIIVEHTTYKRRKVCYMINELKCVGFIKSSKMKHNGFSNNAFTEEGLAFFKVLEIFMNR